MEFGRIDEAALYLVDFKLGPDNSDEILPGTPFDTRWYIGLGQKGTGKAKWAAYLQHLNSVEYGGSYYGVPTSYSIQKLLKEVPSGFRFLPKMTQTITHLKRLKNVEKDLQELMARLSEFGEYLGPMLILPHPQLSPKDIDRIIAFVTMLKGVPYALEVRHQDWYKDTYNKELLQVIGGTNGMTVITDTPGRRDVAHMQLSGPKVVVRFMSCADPMRDQRRLAEWTERLKLWQNKGLQEGYFFAHSDNDEYGLALAESVVASLGVKPLNDTPGKPSDQGSLF